MRSHTELAGRLMEQGRYVFYFIAASTCVHGRYMMYIQKEGAVYMLDRDNAVFSIPSLRFPSRKRVGQHIQQTLLDGVSFIDDHIVI